jgi:two-component system, OmpR family, response regulator MprA
VARVLVVDDEPALAAGLERVLRLEGFEVVVASDGVEGLRLAVACVPDVIVMDVLMPGLDGIEVCRLLRRRGSRTPILILTAMETVGDRVAGLDAGADDYLVKPFVLDELLARLRALLRRGTGGSGDDVLRYDDVSLDPARFEARRGERKLELARTEFALLELFLRNPEQVLTRSLIVDRVWGYDFGPASNSLEVYIGYLRRKTEAGGEPRLIGTVRGVGYVLRSP